MAKSTDATTVWDVFSEYADVRDDLEDVLLHFDAVQDEIRTSVEELADELEDIQTRLLSCDRIFKRYRCGKTPPP